MYILISYGIFLGGNIPNSIKIFRMKKKKTTTSSKKMDSCTELFETMEILSFYSQYIVSPLLYVVKKKRLFTKNLEAHNHDTRSANYFGYPLLI